MEPEQEKPNDQPISSPEAGEKTVVKKRTVFQRVRRVAAWLVLIVFALGLSTLLFVQLPLFKRILVGKLVDAIENSTNSTLIIGDIQGNLLQGFVLNDVHLRLKTGTKYDTVDFIHADHILAKYSLLRWLRKSEIGITSMVIQHPTIRLLKFEGDSIWNYKMLTKPVAVKEAPKPFTQLIDLASFRIQGGSLVVRDYNYPARETKVVAATAEVKEKEIDWADVQMEGIDLDSRFYANGSKAQSAKVNHLRFTEKQSGFFVQHLEFSGYLDSIQARMDEAKITTGHTSIGFSLELSPPRILKTGLFTSLQHSTVNLNLKGPAISTYELKQFLPSDLGFLAGSPGIDLDATGEFGKLKIKHLLLDFKNRGNITINGELHNLQQPDSLRMDLALQARNISNTTLDEYVPGLHIPNLSRFGTINIPSLTYNGIPQNFHTIFDVKTSGAGNIAANIQLDLRKHTFQYVADLKTQNFNLAAIENKPDFESNISANAQLAGRGTNWRTLETRIKLDATAPSTVYHRTITTLDLVATMNKGFTTISGLDATVDGGPEVHVRSASADLVSPSVPFKFDGTIKDFRLAEVLGPSSDNLARVDLDGNFQSSGKNLEEASGKAHIRLFNLQYLRHPIAGVNAELALIDDPRGDDTLSIRSELADALIHRHFRLGDLVHTVPEHVTALITAIKERDFPEEEVHYPPITLCSDSVNFDYWLHLKDLRPLASFFPTTFLLAEGAISGSVSGCPTGDMTMSMNGDSLGLILRNRTDTSAMAIADTMARHTVDNSIVRPTTDSLMAVRLRLGTRDSSGSLRDTSKVLALPQFGQGIPRIHLSPTNFRLTAKNISDDPKHVLDHLDASLDFVTDSVIRLGSALLYHPKFGLVYKNRVLGYDLATVYNDVIGFRLKGDARFPGGEFDFAIDTLLANYFNPAPGAEIRDYKVLNEGVSHIRITPSGLLSIDTLNLLHPLLAGYDPHYASAQRLSFGGTLRGDTVHAWTRVPSFRLEDLRRILPLKPTAKTFEFADFQGKVRDVSATLKGTLQAPEIAVNLFADTMFYGPQDSRIVFDSNAVNLEYRNQALRGSLVLHVDSVGTGQGTHVAINPDSIGALRAVIDSIPMMIAFKHGPNYSADSAAVTHRPLSASINTTHFPIDVATPFLTPFRELHGSGDIHFTMTGTQDNIRYSGAATVHDGALLLDATRLWYLFDGSLVFADNVLRLQDITLRNVPADDPYGLAMLNGSFNFNGFSITNFDLKLHSDRLMVLSNDSRESLKSIYGPVTISTGGGDFHFRNTLQAPWINGNIDILSAKLTLPQSGPSQQTVSSVGIEYYVHPIDTSASNLSSEGTPISMDSSNLSSKREALACLVNAGSVQMTVNDDTLFPNCMKNIYLNDDGTIRKTDTLMSETEAPSQSSGPSFADKLRMDLQINTQGNVSLLVPFNGVFGVLGAKLAAELRSDGSITVQRGDELGPVRVQGIIDLTQNSTFTFYQTFNIASGQIIFNNDFSNPEINIVADYIGTHHRGTGFADEQAKIELDVTGTKSNPKLDAHIYVQNPETQTYEERPEAPGAGREDAIYFLASGGQFKTDLTPNDQASVLSSAGYNLGSSLVTSLLANYLGSTSSEFALRSANLNLGSGTAQLTAAWRNVVLRYNLNSTANLGGSADYIVDIPLDMIANNPEFRSMIIELLLHPGTQSNTNGLVQQNTFLTKLIWTPWHF